MISLLFKQVLILGYFLNSMNQFLKTLSRLACAYCSFHHSRAALLYAINICRCRLYIQIIESIFHSKNQKMQSSKTYDAVYELQLNSVTIAVKNCSAMIKWKRTNRVVTSSIQPIVDSKANFKSQKLVLKLQMKLNLDLQLFQEKKTLISVLLKVNEKQKLAGQVTLDLAPMTNDRLKQVNKNMPLEKCPDPNGAINFNIRLLSLAQKQFETKSQSSMAQRSQLDLLNDLSIIQSSVFEQPTANKLSQSARTLFQQGSKLQVAIQTLSQSTNAQLQRLKQQLRISISKQQKLNQRVNFLQKEKIGIVQAKDLQIEQIKIKLISLQRQAQSKSSQLNQSSLNIQKQQNEAIEKTKAQLNMEQLKNSKLSQQNQELRLEKQKLENCLKAKEIQESKVIDLIEKTRLRLQTAYNKILNQIDHFK